MDCAPRRPDRAVPVVASPVAGRHVSHQARSRGVRSQTRIRRSVRFVLPRRCAAERRNSGPVGEIFHISAREPDKWSICGMLPVRAVGELSASEENVCAGQEPRSARYGSPTRGNSAGRDEHFAAAPVRPRTGTLGPAPGESCSAQLLVGLQVSPSTCRPLTWANAEIGRNLHVGLSGRSAPPR
jgi:hypothetical protein